MVRLIAVAAAVAGLGQGLAVMVGLNARNRGFGHRPGRSTLAARARPAEPPTVGQSPRLRFGPWAVPRS
jgi:hypothetical protein